MKTANCPLSAIMAEGGVVGCVAVPDGGTAAVQRGKAGRPPGSCLSAVQRPFARGTAASAEQARRPTACLQLLFCLAGRGFRPPGGTCFLPWRPREHGRPVFCPVICIISVSQWRLPALRRWRGAWSAVRARLPPRRREPWRQSLRFRVFLRCGQCLPWSF